MAQPNESGGLQVYAKKRPKTFNDIYLMCKL